MKYFMRSKAFKLKEDFWVKNELEEDCFFVDTKLFSLGTQFSISKNNNIIYQTQQKLLAFMATYEVFENEEIVAEVKKKFTFFNNELHISSKYGDMHVIGDIFDYNYKIIKDDQVIAESSREFTWSISKIFSHEDCYEVDINFEDEAFILSLVVIVDDIIDKQKRNSMY